MKVKILRQKNFNIKFVTKKNGTTSKALKFPPNFTFKARKCFLLKMQMRDKSKYKIVSMCEDSEPYNKIAKKVGVSKSTVSRTMTKHKTYNIIKHL